MTWNELAEACGVDLIDMIGDAEEAEDMGELELWRCFFLDDMIVNLNDNHENMPIVRAINRSLLTVNETPYALAYR